MAPATTPAAGPATSGGGSTLSLGDVRRLWPDIVEATKLKRRVTWIHLTQHAQVVAVDAKTLTLGFSNTGARESFVNGGSPEIVRQAAIDVVGTDWRIDAIVDPGATAPAPQTQPTAPAAQPAASSPAAPAQGGTPAPPEPGQAQAQAPDGPPDWASASPADTGSQAAPTQPAATPEAVSAAREAILSTRPVGAPPKGRDDRALADSEADRDDPDADSLELAGAELLQRELGATIIDEIRHD